MPSAAERSRERAAERWAARVSHWLFALQRVTTRAEVAGVEEYVIARELHRMRPPVPDWVRREVDLAESVLREFDEERRVWEEERGRGGQLVVEWSWEGKAPPAPVVPIEAASGRPNMRKRSRARMMRRSSGDGGRAA